MMFGVSNDGAAAAADAHESGGGASGGSSEVGASSSIPGGVMEESERSGGGGGGGGGGNRWPRQETLALLKIRSEMDVTFRDSSLKGPLWEEVSRKMAELGYQRSSKKCKEKFENVYKYHKRTKDGRASKSDGKTYRFFDQLEALEKTTSTLPPPPPFTTTAAAPHPPRLQLPPATPTPLMLTNSAPAPPLVHTTVSSTTPNPVSTIFPNINTSGQPPLQHHQQQQPPPPNIIPPQSHTFQHLPRPHMSSARPPSDSTSNSSTSSDEDIQRRRGRKRKWKDFFERLMKDVIHKQEELQKKFLDTLEKRERDRTAREEAWRMQEMARLNREHELLVHERSIAAAKDAAVISFLQKVTEQHNLQIPIGNIISAPPHVVPVQAQPPENIPQPQQQPPQQPPPPPPPPPKPPATAPPATQTRILDIVKVSDNGGDNSTSSASSSRWPKAEVEALIKLRTTLDIKYQENGPKGPLWEEISSAMSKIGYNRSSKRCKEKWENINKYFKKVKESNKKRPEDSKTCPYFHQLDAIYRERGSKTDVVPFPGYNAVNPENIPMLPIMARPEQQWPLPDEQQRQHDSAMPVAERYQDNDSENNDHDDGDDDGDDDDEEDEAQCYEIVTNKQPSSVTNAAE